MTRNASAARIRKNRPETGDLLFLNLVVWALLLICAERNHMSPNISLLNRVRSEFIEMPGLRLRIDQAQRLWNLDRAMCESVLRSLVDAKFLRRFEDDLYARL